MRREVFKLWHLVQRRQALEEAASSISSPGFEPHYSSSRNTAAPYEAYIIAACDMAEEIDEAVRAIVDGIEADNAEILKKASGQRQRALRLKFICNKPEKDIADRLGLSVKTLQNRMEGMDEKAPDGEFAVFCLETELLPIDAEIEEHIAYTYERVELMAEERYPDVDKLILRHRAKGRALRRKYAKHKARIDRFVESLEGKQRIIAEMWLDGKSKREIMDAAECSARWVEKILAGFSGF